MVYKGRTEGGHTIYGNRIGILLQETVNPRIPGDVGNATTYNFPVLFKIVKGATVERLIYENDPDLLELFLNAARELEREGVRAVTSSCGFTAIFQKEMVKALNIQVFMSSLIQVPFVSSLIGKDKKVGILTAHKGRLTEAHLKAVDITEDIPICIAGMEEKENFANMLLRKQDPFGYIEKIEMEMIEVAKDLVKNNRDIGAIVLECTNMPPYAAAIQEAVNLPIYDIVSLVNYVHFGAVKHRFQGIL